MTKTFESIYTKPDGTELIIARGSSEKYVSDLAHMSQFVPFTIREYQTEDNIREMYREWRKENENKKPNRVIVKMHWEDDPENINVDTIAIIRGGIDICNIPSDDAQILFYCSSLKELLQLLKPGSGADFILDEVLEFYKK